MKASLRLLLGGSLLVGFLVLASSGCRYYDPSEVPCYGDHHCPTTMTCVGSNQSGGGVCSTEGSSDFCLDGELCSNTCSYAGDGDCDDGGPGSDFSLCEYGTDCEDCGCRD